jgi:hypothetical protein
MPQNTAQSAISFANLGVGQKRKSAAEVLHASFIAFGSRLSVIDGIQKMNTGIDNQSSITPSISLDSRYFVAKWSKYANALIQSTKTTPFPCKSEM